MDDVDSVQASIARNMLESGDWVTARLNGVAYLEKAPLIYWMMAVSYHFFGVHDWAARLPLALSVILLCWVTYRFGRWAFDDRAGLYAGLALATSAGLFLFTRILIPDAILTLAITGAIGAGLRLLDPEEESTRTWAAVLGACLGIGVLLKGLIALIFPLATGVIYMAVTSQLTSRKAWRRLHAGTTLVVMLAIAAPWHVLATLRNPPCFAFSMHSGPGEYRGFFWFYFINEHVLRFLNLRYPRDYNTVPRLWFWLLNLVWMFPWSVYLLGARKLSFRPDSRTGRARLMALCWIAVVMVFFTFSTTQEYYSMPIYPAIALLVGSGLSRETSADGSATGTVAIATKIVAGVFAGLFVVLAGILLMVWHKPASGSIASALTQHPELYTLSLGHIRDLTLSAFAYLKLPMVVAAIAFGFGAVGLFVTGKTVMRAALVLTLAMIIFFQATRIALMRFEDYLGSYPLAQALEQNPPGQLIEANAYYAFSSVFFYTGRTALLWNGRENNLEYGSYAPGAAKVFIDDSELARRWKAPTRCYLLAYGSELPHLKQLVESSTLYIIKENAGNYLLTNHPNGWPTL